MAQTDAAFAVNYAKPNKSISKCCQYIFQEVGKIRKSGEKCVGCSDEEVFGMAVHYYDEDDIEVNDTDTGVADVQRVEESAKEQPKKRRKSRKKEAVEIQPEAEDTPTESAQNTADELPDELVVPLF